jgi:hypothetical protein
MDPVMIADPTQRKLHILKQKWKKSLVPGRVYAPLKGRSTNNRNQSHYDIPVQNMVDLTDVIKRIKIELPHTRPRLRRQTYKSMLLMKKQNNEITEQLRIQQGEGDSEYVVFKEPNLTQILRRERKTLTELNEFAF